MAKTPFERAGEAGINVDTRSGAPARSYNSVNNHPAKVSPDAVKVKDEIKVDVAKVEDEAVAKPEAKVKKVTKKSQKLD